MDDDDDEDDDEEDDDETYPQPREDEEEEVEEEPDENQTARLKRLKRSRVNDRRKARQNGFRMYAEMAGACAGNQSFGNDILMNIFSPSDVKRLATWCPSTGDVHVKLEQFETHLALRDESLSSGPLRILTANLESFARKIVHELVLRNVESASSMTISAANVKSVLRPFSGSLHTSDFNVPSGIVRIAQQTPSGKYETDENGNRFFVENEDFLLPKNEDDDVLIAEERRFAKVNQTKKLREADKLRDAAVAERKRMKRTEKQAITATTTLATGVAA